VLLLDVRGLKKSYRSPGEPSGAATLRPVLDVPSFRLESGEQAAIAGTSGSGKTTFLNVVAGIQRGDAGQVLFDGTDLSRLSEGARDAFRARNVGYVFQSFHLLQGYTAIENVLLGMLFGPGPDRAWARSLLEELGLSGHLRHRPSQLSIGQQQRVALARALANRPRLVLADEPTGNLDQERAAAALDLLRRLCRAHGAALVVVSHDRTVLDAFERMEDFRDLNRAAARAHAGTEVG